MSKWNRIGFVAVIAVLLAALLPACSGLSSGPRIVATSAPEAGAQDDLAALMTRGADVWADNCARCHGRMGGGTAEGAPLPDLTGYTDEQILASITNGVGEGDLEMPAFGDQLSPIDLDAAMTYAKMMSLAISRGMVTVTEEAGVVVGEPISTPDVGAPLMTLEAAAPASSVGTVIGAATNGTPGRSLPPGLTLTLHVITSDTDEQRFDATVNADGSYRIENVPFDATYQYVITLPYGDVQYASELVNVDPLLLELTLPITIYEGGAPAEAIVVTAMSSQIIVQTNVMQVIQLARFTNTSDRVYFSITDGVGTSVEMAAPQGAQILNSVSDRYIVTSDGTAVADTRPMLPGSTHLIHLSYSLPYNGSSNIVQPLNYALDGHLDVVMVTDGLSFSGDGFAAQAPVTSGGITMASYGATLTNAAGTPVTFTVSGASVASETAGASSTSATAAVTPLAYILIGAGISALLIAGYTLWREKSKPAVSTASGVPARTDSTSARKATIGDLMEQIAALEAQYKAGKVEDRVYQRQRAALKSQLTALMTAE